ncbi:MAG: hypothetical protein QME42_10890 [bacterium]|nr:hypothetical protein [bacterium]
MLDSNLQLKLNKSLLTTRIVYFAFMVSLVIYLFIPNIIIKLEHGNFDGFARFKEVDLLKNIIYLISGLTVVVVLVLRRFLTNLPTSTVDEILKGLISGNIVLFALSESPVIYGLVLFIIAGMLKEFYFSIGLSFVLLLICFPNRTQWEEIMRQFSQTI